LKELFINQLDYIFFFYGLAFFFLAVFCFLFYRSKETKLPWFYLFLFAFVHGTNEWMDMASMSFENIASSVFIRSSLLGLSFLFLFEFGRRAFNLASKSKIGAWVYLLITPIALAGLIIGNTELNVTLRYFVGFTGGILSAASIWAYSKSENIKYRPTLQAFALTLAIYALSMGIIVPRVGFFPGNIINYDLFFSVFQFPVQLLRGLLALLLSFLAWNYFIETNKEKNRLLPKHQYSRILIVVFCLIIGWLLVNFLGNKAYQDLLIHNNLQVELLSTHLQVNL